MTQKKFLQAMLKNPRRVGAIAQTSPHVAKEIISAIDFKKSRVLVELGSGPGNITKKILEKMSGDSVLFCFEVDKNLAANLRKEIRDPRVKIICDSAEKIGEYLTQSGHAKADCIISTVPLTTLPYGIMKRILLHSYQYLNSGGNYIQVQYSLLGRKHLRLLFPSMSISFIFLNFPPAFVYSCLKI